MHRLIVMTIQMQSDSHEGLVSGKSSSRVLVAMGLFCSCHSSYSLLISTVWPLSF